MTVRIEDYALLGNCRTAALVSNQGSIDWLCFPRFDSPSCFAALLGDAENGHWEIRPSSSVKKVKRAYRDGTLILETTFTTGSGEATLIDFMPTTLGQSSVVRIVVGRKGRLSFDMDLVMRMDYGRSVPWAERPDSHTLTAVAGPDLLVLRTLALLKPRAMHTISTFSVGEGERMTFMLSHQSSSERIAEPFDADTALTKTEYFWRQFSDRCPDVGSWSGTVKRSLITLKALTYLPTGGIVAAATTSLPERLGGERNWDYRYCWLRDATMTLLAFMSLGYFDEAAAWRDWLTRSVAGNPNQMQIMYGLAGERRLPEYELPWLSGYENSRPVRIGNAAATQTQLDVFGEVADAMVQAIKGKLPPHPRIAAIAEVIVPFLETAWREPDEGIWEVRAQRQHFTHSKVMAWVTFDRISIVAASMENGHEFSENCRRIANEIHAEVCHLGYDPELGSFVQYYGSKSLDASLLHIALTGFLPPDDSRVLGTVAAIETNLMCDGLLLRYDSQAGVDGLPAGEGTFLACSFWLADVYVLLGRHDDARVLFERLIGLCNDVGLLAEQYDSRERRMLGNFPQAFSHVGIIDTALNLHRHWRRRKNARMLIHPAPIRPTAKHNLLIRSDTIMEEKFRALAERISYVVGSSWSFVAAIVLVLVWILTGPVFHYSDTWQLVINTGTTIITFLMVFLIQNTQNRDAIAVQLKLDELLRGVKGARTEMINLDMLSDADLARLRTEFQKLAEKKGSR